MAVSRRLSFAVGHLADVFGLDLELVPLWTAVAHSQLDREGPESQPVAQHEIEGSAGDSSRVSGQLIAGHVGATAGAAGELGMDQAEEHLFGAGVTHRAGPWLLAVEAQPEGSQKARLSEVKPAQLMGAGLAVDVRDEQRGAVPDVGELRANVDRLHSSEWQGIDGASVTNITPAPAANTLRQPVSTVHVCLITDAAVTPRHPGLTLSPEVAVESRVKFAGHPLHPMMIAFPLGLLGAAAIFDLIYLVSYKSGWTQAAFYMIIAGCVSGLLAAVPGALDWWPIPRGTRAKRIGL